MIIIYSISLSSHTKFLFYVYFMLTVAPGGNNLATIYMLQRFSGPSHYKYVLLLLLLLLLLFITTSRALPYLLFPGGRHKTPSSPDRK